MRQKESKAKVKQVKGKVKQAVGILTGDSKLEQAGRRQRAEGAIQETVGKAQRKVGDFVEGVARAIKK